MVSFMQLCLRQFVTMNSISTKSTNIYNVSGYIIRRTFYVQSSLQSRSRLRILRLKRQQQETARNNNYIDETTNLITDNLITKQGVEVIKSTDRAEGIEIKKLFNKSTHTTDIDLKELIRGIIKHGKSKNKSIIGKSSIPQSSIILMSEFDIDVENIIIMLRKESRILNISTDVLKSRLMMLNKHGFHVAKELFLFRNPSILLSKLENTMDEKVKFLLKLDVRPRLLPANIMDMVRKCPDLIQFSTAENMMNKTTFISQKLKMDSSMLGLFIYKLPSIMTFSIEAIDAKATFCLRAMNIEHSELAKCPRVFSTSLQRLKTRYMFLKHCNLINMEHKLPAKSLNRIASYSDRDFAEKLTGRSLEEYIEYKEKSTRYSTQR